VTSGIPDTRGALNALNAGQLDEIMAALRRQPFGPHVGIGRRRQETWRAIQHARSLGGVPCPPTRPALLLADKRPGALPRAVRDGASLLRSMFLAALSGISKEDAAAIAEAHFLGQCEARDGLDEARRCFQVLGAAGWGIETDRSGILRIYR